MMDELRRLRELTETLTGNGYLRDQTEEWEHALSAIPESIYIINTKHKIKYANPAFLKRIDKAMSDIYDQRCYKIIGFSGCDVPSEDVCYENEIYPIDTCLFREVYLEKLNGWFDITKSPIYTRSQKLLGFICVLQDITDQKVAIEALKESEAKYRFLLDNSLDAIWMLDVDLNFTFINPAIKSMTGYTQEEWIGTNLKEHCTEESYNKLTAYVAEAITDSNFKELKFKIDMLTKENDVVSVEVTSRALRNEDGYLIGFQGNTRILDR